MIELSTQKKQLVNYYSNLVIEIEFDFLQNKLFQPIGIELSACPVVIETEENHSFKGLYGNDSSKLPLAFYRPDTDSIHIFVEHPSFTKRVDETAKKMFLSFLLFHEAGHRLFMTVQRQNERDSELWNIVTDLEIHNMFYVYNELIKNSMSSDLQDMKKTCKYIEDFLINKNNPDPDLNEGLFEKEYLQLVAEEIYNDLLKSKKEKSVTYSFDKDGNLIDESNNEFNSEGGKIKVTMSEYKLPSGKKIQSTNIDYSDLKVTPKSAEECERQKNDTIIRKTILENVIKEEAKTQEGRGVFSAECQNFLGKMFHIKIDWKKILRNSLHTALEKSDYFSWSRPRISMYGMQNAPYLPEQCYDTEKCGVLVVARDESGSMSDTEVAKAAGIIADAKAHYKKIIVIKHDHTIVKINEFEELDEKAKNMLLERCSCGGTSHKEVFEWIRDYYIKHRDTEESISCVICISDLDSDIESWQEVIPTKIPMIYLAPIECTKRHSKIKGTMIPVEL